MIDPVAQALFKSSLYPAPINGNLINNAVNTRSNNFNSNQYDVKVDYNISEKDRLYGRYSHAFQKNPTLNTFKLFGTGFSEAPIYSGLINWTHTISHNLLNDARMGVNYVKLHNGTTFESSVGNLGETLGIANSNPAGIPGLLGLGFTRCTPALSYGETASTSSIPATAEAWET